MSSSKRRIIPSGITKVAVLPHPERTAPPRQAGPRQPLRWWKVPVGIYNWALWFFVVTVVLSQFLGIVSNSTKSVMYNDFGQSPLLDTSSISGDNDDPYSDRMIVCKLRGRLYKPALVSAVLAEPSAVLVDSDGLAINGYRVIKRNTATLTSDAYALYSNTCDEIAATLDAILDSCTALGYNVTRDNLRVVDDLDSSKMYLIPNSLPVLVMPYWDNSPYPHYAIPGWDGSACTFRLTGKYQSQAYSTSAMFGPDRSVRESKTAEWLKRSGGVWKNGWYEDLTGAKWYSDIATTDLHDPYGINQRLFDTISNQERNLSHSTDFVDLPVTTWWGDKLSVTDTAHDLVSIVVSNGFRQGLFVFRNSPVRVVKCAYDLETFISNASMAVLLLRWVVVMLILQSSYWRHKCSQLESAGIGCLSSSRTFLLFPVVLLPRLKQSLTAFFTVGCFFEGEQMVFSEAWFVIYPGIVEFVLLYFSLLNLLARYFSRRMTDIFFGPTLTCFCLMHYLRVDIGQSDWFGIDGRVSPVFSAKDFEDLKLLDFVSTDVALRINGNILSIFVIKMVVIGLNLLPLFFATRTSSKSPTAKRYPPCQIEKALAIRACCIGGLGPTSYYHEITSVLPQDNTTAAVPTFTVNSYELLRMGYIVLGDKFLITLVEWVYYCYYGGLGSTRYPSNCRLLLFRAEEKSRGYAVVGPPAFVRVRDSRLQNVRFWQVSAVPFE